MRRAKRIRTLCGELLSCKSFADVGCDHGYCTQYMLERELCGSAVFSEESPAADVAENAAATENIRDEDECFSSVSREEQIP